MKLGVSTSLLFTLVSSVALSPIVLASGDASFSISSPSSVFSVGSEIVVTVYETSSDSDNTNAVEANLSYDSSKLLYDGTTLGVFTYCAQNKGGNGAISVACATSTGQLGTQMVMGVRFKVLTSGTTQVKMAKGSAIDNTSGRTVWNGILPSATYSLGSSSKTDTSDKGVQPTTPPTMTGNSRLPTKRNVNGVMTKSARNLDSLVPYGLEGIAIVIVASGGKRWWYFRRR